jgi:hypothetical protein
MDKARELYARALEDAGCGGSAFIRKGHGNIWVDPALAVIATLLKQAEAAPGVVEAVKAEIERQCSIGAGTCQRDSETGLIEVHADIDANGFAAAMTEALARQHGAQEQ